MNLAKFVQVLELRYPRLFAASWDNVGLLVNPPNVTVKNILLTNDFTKAVLDEAKANNCSLVICYHPVLFKGIKSLDIDSGNKDALCLEAFLNRIAVYCPHTVLDTVADGVNDWLISRFGNLENATIRPVKPFAEFTKYFHSVISVDVLQSLERLCVTGGGGSPNFYVFSCDNRSYIFSNLAPLDQRWYNYFDTFDNESMSERLRHNFWGDGRIIDMETPLSIEQCVEIVKKHLRIPHVMLASPRNSANSNNDKIKTIAVCAGSGGSVLRGLTDVDLIITGELDHHSVLEFVEKGAYVIVTNHSNSERGFLETYLHQINSHFDCFNIPSSLFPRIFISQMDCDPLKVV